MIVAWAHVRKAIACETPDGHLQKVVG